MQIFLFGLVCVAFLAWGWPRLLVWSIRQHWPQETYGSLLHKRAGEFILTIGLAGAIGLAVLFIVTDDNRSWTDVDSAVSAVVIVAAVLFGYGRLFPPAFFPAFYSVTNLDSGAFIENRTNELQLPSGSFWPIFVVVYNIGIAPWTSYRITLTIEDAAGFDTFLSHGGIPASDYWDWKTEDLRVNREKAQVQVQRSHALVVGEPQTIRYVVKTPDTPNRFRMCVTVAVDGRLSESTSFLWLNVQKMDYREHLSELAERSAKAERGTQRHKLEV